MIENTDDLPSLPDIWAWTRLEEIGIVASGGTPSTSVPEYFEGDVPWITPADLSSFTGKFIQRGRRNISEKGLHSSSAVLLPAGTILFSSRAPIGYVAVAANPIATNQGFKNLTLHEGVFNEYVFHYLKASKKLAESYGSGTTFREVSASRFRLIPIPLAPYNEQVRIAARLEELFTRLDAGVEGLRKVKAQLKRYCQAVLKYAFEGKLTEEWRKTHKHQTQPTTKLPKRVRQNDEEYVDPSSANRLALNGLPENWSWEKIGAIADLISGQHIMKEDYNFDQSGLPYLTGPADFGSKSPIVSKWTTKPKVVAKDGDVLVTVKGAGVGKVNILEIKEAVISRQLMAIRARHARAKFVFHYVQYTFDNIRKMGSGSTVPGIRREELLGLLLPFPSIAEQDQIVSEIENRMQVVVDVEKTLARSLRQAESLRQSILKHAFEGKLVPQDPNDEPAEKLLERFKAERAKSKDEKDTNRKNKSQLELSTYVK